MSTEGIVTNHTYFNTYSWKQPLLIQNLKSCLCVLYCVDSKSKLHCIEHLEKQFDPYRTVHSFKGIYGHDANKHFECKGMCVDNEGNILYIIAF